MAFSDHFSTQADRYAQFRPTYPRELYDYLFDQTPLKERAWDCATGNGQAALALAEQFGWVEASDGSERQIAHASPHPKVRYQVARASETTFPDNHFDLVTVAQALHWFAHDDFYQEVKRVLKPGGLFAAWGYVMMEIDPKVDKVVNWFYEEVTEPFWPPERAYVAQRYQSISFPFEESFQRDFEIKKRWTLNQVLGYFSTWSAVQRYKTARNEDPVSLVEAPLREAWGDPEESKEAIWPVFMRLAKLQAS